MERIEVPLKAPESIILTLSGISIFSSSLQSLKDPEPMVSREEGSTISFRFQHILNRLSGRDIIDDGIVTLERLWQFSKAPLPMHSTPSGMITSFSSLQSENAFSSITMREEGNTTFSIEQEEKADLEIISVP